MVLSQGVLGYSFTSLMGSVVAEIFEGPHFGSIFSIIVVSLLAGDAAGYGRVADYNGRRQEGLAPMPMTVFHEGPRRGERCSTFAAYLEPAMDAHDALGVVTGACAARVEFDGTRAVAVATTDGRRFEAEQEVILCAGAIATPQLLQISGVGPADLLESLGVDVVVGRVGRLAPLRAVEGEVVEELAARAALDGRAALRALRAHVARRELALRHLGWASGLAPIRVTAIPGSFSREHART